MLRTFMASQSHPLPELLLFPHPADTVAPGPFAGMPCGFPPSPTRREDSVGSERFSTGTCDDRHTPALHFPDRDAGFKMLRVTFQTGRVVVLWH